MSAIACFAGGNGCAGEDGSAKSEEPPPSEEASVEHFQGFDVVGPIDNRWHLERHEDKPHVADFHFSPLSRTHSFNATVFLRGLPHPVASAAEFKALIDSKLQQHDPRMELLSHESELTEVDGQWAVRYDLRFLDTNPANSKRPLIMTIKGRAYLHPLLRGIVIDSWYSERGLKKELTGKLDSAGEKLLQCVVPTQ